MLLKGEIMQVIPLEIKLTCVFGTLDSQNSYIEKKDSFNIDIQKLDRSLFNQTFEELVKIKEELSKGNNPYAASPTGNQA